MNDKLSTLLRPIISVLLVLGPPIFFGLLGDAKKMAVAIIPGAFAAVFVNLDRFTKFKGAGFEAEVARVEKVVDDAEKTLSLLRDVAEPMISATLETITMGSRLGGMGREKKIEYRNKLLDAASSLGISQRNEIEQADRHFVHMHTWDYFGDFIESLRSTNGDGYSAFSKRYEERYKTSEYPTKDRIEADLESIGIKLNAHQEEKLSTYLEYRNSALVED